MTQKKCPNSTERTFNPHLGRKDLLMLLFDICIVTLKTIIPLLFSDSCRFMSVRIGLPLHPLVALQVYRAFFFLFRSSKMFSGRH